MASGRKGRFSGRGRNAEKEEAASKGAEVGSTTDEKSNLAASESSFGSGHREPWMQGELVREIEAILLLVIFKLQNDYILQANGGGRVETPVPVRSLKLSNIEPG